MDKITKIYYLTDYTNIPRYIGKTIQTLEARLQRHLYYKEDNKTHKVNWIRSVNKEIKIILLEQCDFNIANEREIFWINEYRKNGYDLTNTTIGGDGGFTRQSKTLTIEHKNKISQAKKGKSLTEEHKIKIKKSCKGRISPRKGEKLSDETKKKISEYRKGKKLSKEHRENIAKGNLGRIVSKETRLKIGEANRKNKKPND